MGGPENVPLVEALAKALGGEVAATRAVVDAGWVPVLDAGRPDRQDRRRRSCTSPAASRAPSSTRWAWRTPGTIIAINKDKNAPIFEFADVGVVGDALAILPKLTELVAAGGRPAGAQGSSGAVAEHDERVRSRTTSARTSLSRCSSGAWRSWAPVEQRLSDVLAEVVRLRNALVVLRDSPAED